MTREEAIAFLYSVAGDLGFTDVENYTCKDGKKMREAIQALEIVVPEHTELKEFKVGEKIPPEEWQKGKSVTEIIEEVRERMCNKYCKYPYEWYEETQGELSESEICEKCPLNRL